MTKAPNEYQPPLPVVRTVLALTVPALAGLLLLLLLSPLGRRRARNMAVRLVSGSALWLAGLSVRCDDPDALLLRRPAILVINHQSALDPLLVGAVLRRDVTPVVKASLRHQFPIGWLLRLAGAVFVQRDADTGSAALAPAADALARHMAVVIAPEGTRRPHVTAGSFRPGAVALARQTGVPVVMLYICDAGAHMGNNVWSLRPGTIRLRVLGIQEAQQVSLASLEAAYLGAQQQHAGDS